MVKLSVENIGQDVMDFNLAKAGYTAFYVDGANGLDTYPGDSWEQPFKTIQHAIDTAKSWTKIFVKAGTYAENIVIDDKDGISLEGEDKTTTIISVATGDAVTSQNNINFGLENFKLIAPEATKDSIVLYNSDYATIYQCDCSDGIWVRVHSDHVTIDSVVVDGNDQNGAVIADCDYVTIVDSEFKNNTKHGLEIYHCSYSLIEKCLFHDNGWCGVAFNIIYPGGYSKDDEIRDCHFYSNTSLSDIYAYATVYVYRLKLHDNNFSVRGTSGAPVLFYGSHMDECDIYHNNFVVGSVMGVYDVNTGNRWYENYYSDHTVDTNNDGLCDSPYLFTNNIDRQPVSKRNGWKRESLGYDSATVNSLTFKGTVTTATSATVFASTDLTGHGNKAFKDDWYVYVFHDAGGAGAAPQGEYRSISDYVSSTGTFTHTAFSANIALTDEVFIIHSSMLPADGNVFARTGTVYFVGKGGLDANNGKTWETRRLTVASGYGLCSAGDTLIIGTGTFTEDINFNADGVHVIGRGHGIDGTMITGNATMTCRSNRFEDIFFYDTSGTVVKVGADANASYNEFPNCRIGGSGSAIDLHIDGSVANGGCFNIFDTCNFYDATQASVLIDGANAPTGNVFRACRVRPTTNGHGIHVNHASALRNTFLDCTVVGNSSGGTGIYFQAGLANIAANCHVDDITTPYNIAATNHIVGCHEGSLIATNNTTEDDLKKLYDDLVVVDGLHDVPAKDAVTDSYIRDVAGKKDDTAQTTVGTTRSIIAYIKGLLNQVALVKTATDKQAGESPVTGTTVANWNAAEADIVSIGTNDTKKKLHSLLLSIDDITAGSVITIRMYMQVNGVEQEVYDQPYTKGTDPNGIWVVDGMVGIHEVLRVTAQSDTAADDTKNIRYDYMLEAM